MWGDRKCSSRGEQVQQYVTGSPLVLLNDGDPSHVEEWTGNTSTINLTLVTPHLPNISWNMLDDPLGSDHFPLLIYDARHNQGEEGGSSL